MISQAISGALEMYILPIDLLAPRNPVCGILGVGFAFPDYDHVWAAVDGELGNMLRGVAEQIGFYCLDKGFEVSRESPVNFHAVSPRNVSGFMQERWRKNWASRLSALDFRWKNGNCWMLVRSRGLEPPHPFFDHRAGVLEQRFGGRLDDASFSGAGRSQEQEVADRSARGSQTGLKALIGLHDFGDGVILSDHKLAQPGLQGLGFPSFLVMVE